jgi:hypothetical protein
MRYLAAECADLNDQLEGREFSALNQLPKTIKSRILR